MGRAEKRRMDRTEKWFNSLSEDKRQTIYDIINEKINSNNLIMNAISDTCIIGAVDDIFEPEISDINKVITKVKEYMIDYGDYLEREKNGGIKMIENEELRNDIKVRIKKYISGKIDKARGLKLLRNEFNLPFAELSDLWIECKEVSNTKKVIVPKEMVAEKNIKPKEIEKKVSGLEVKEVEKDKIKPVCNVGVVNMKSNDIEKPTTKNGLRIINITTEIEGKYGTYIKNKDGITIDGKLYSDKYMVKKTQQIASSAHNVKMNCIKERIKALEKELENIRTLEHNERDKFEEIESVFNL